jgi:predicted nucleic acid-binding protein
MIMASGLEGGGTRLYSEDFNAYAHIDGRRIINPFQQP